MEEIIFEIENSETLSFDKSFELAQLCSTILDGSNTDGHKLVINILNNWRKIHPSTIEIWSDLIEAAGFYPYLEKNIGLIKLKGLPGELRRLLRKSHNLEQKYFHDEQFEILKLLELKKNLIVSAPTSFGKSLLIEEIVASQQYNNLVIIQPTLALLDETRRKLLKYKDLYKLIVRTSQEPNSNGNNIFLFTAERVNEYQLFPHIDFVVIDEFYKLSGNRDDERSSSLNNAFHYLLKNFDPNFYLLGPNIDGISEGFEKKYNAVFYPSKFSLVDSRNIDLFKDYKNKFGKIGPKKLFKEQTLFELLITLSHEQTIIYCSSPNRVRYLAKEFVKYLGHAKIPNSEYQYPIIEWIKKYVSTDWCVLDFLNCDIGIHDGALQKHICTSIIDYFNTGKIKFLFCTSTIIEGVNTSAKNIIYFDDKRGGHDIDFFDYSNIKGRAGRMMEHYVGRIFNFNKPPEDEKIIIDIPFFQQAPIKDEVLIQLESDEVLDKNSKQYKDIDSIPLGEKNLIKKNGVSVSGQKSLFDILRQDVETKYHLIEWTYPTYEQLTYVLFLAWEHLIVPGETTSPMTKKKLVKMTFDYGLSGDINKLIQNSFNYYRSHPDHVLKTDKDLWDQAIQETFQAMKHWFEYKVPKWLSVVNEIQRFICFEKGLRPGNYILYANSIENDFLRQNLAILAEYGIPSSAIKKIEKNIPENLDQDLVLNFIREKGLYNSSDLLEYEKGKIRENITLGVKPHQ